jgi:hypothetical protein
MQDARAPSDLAATRNAISQLVTSGLDPIEGEAVFMSAEAKVQRTTELLGDGALVVEVAPPSTAMRGRLAELIDEVIERELARVGAGCPYIAEWTAMPEDAAARFDDQLFRMKSAGATGLVVALGSIAAIARPALTPEDSATLQRLALATRATPFVLLLDDGDVRALAYAAPMPLDALLEIRSTHDLTTNETIVAEAVTTTNEESRPSHASSYEQARRRLHVARIEDSAPEPPHGEEASLPLPPAQEPLPFDERPTSPIAVAPFQEPVPMPVEAVAPAPEPDPLPEPVPEPKKRVPRDRKRASTVGIPVSGPNDSWRTWAIALSSARGPQTLATFERLFAESYVPLANAIADGLDDARALRAYDEFRRAFERTYTEAFATFGVTNRRPRLVMDAYDIASKQSRLHNARSAHVLVVDSMRYDLGALVRDALARAATGVASLTSETVLWSALPTTTLRQLETFARGMDALRAPSPIEPAESLRGRSAEVVRRLRVGSRELYKLDLVPAMLEGYSREVAWTTSAGASSHHETIAEAVAEALFHHLRTVAPRTLVLILGDHGFTVDRRGELLHGGASPEEVLVPAHAWLVGDLH